MNQNQFTRQEGYQENVNLIRNLYIEGKSLKEIAKISGKSTTNVYNHFKGLKKRRDDKARLRELKIKLSLLSEADKGYIAGIIDGEGCFSISIVRKRFYSPKITIANIDQGLREYIESKILISGNKIHIRKDGMWYWGLYGYEKIALFLDTFEPYFKLSKTKEKINILRRLYLGNREEIYLESKAITQRPEFKTRRLT